MIELHETSTFSKWMSALKDVQARVRIQARLLRLRGGNFGDVKPVGQGVSELRIDYGPGYRVYFIQKKQQWVLLLVGGDKRTQTRDIKRAIELASYL